MADTQLGMYRADEEWSEEVEMASRSISYINRLKPKFVVVCGDLINAWPDQADVRKEQVQSYKELMGQIDEDIPLLCLCGNHDVGNRPNSRTIALYSKDFGDDYYTFTVGGVLFVVTNSILPWGLTKQARDGEVGPDDGEELDKKQWEWLEGTLKEASAAKYTHIILLTHVSPFIRDPEEHEGYFNMPLPVRKRLLRLASEAGVKAIFAGHYHRNAGGWYTDSCGHRLEVVTTTAIGCQINSSTGSGADPLELSGMGEFVMDENRCGLRQVDVSEEAVSHKFITVAEMMKCSENPQ
ncbi:Serine/threonine-protein phosphatase cpped1 [Perkinsus olseni]|uniref:Serine/threonine-protein phosphatase cpped1 n=1 Tax=Perkinsus olseni TaxID=32597 RepID=A0A7J6KRY1_PEROL|nr:Serine/threonine-protein phosphatase cpped1 [Perkinsus olseni]